MKSANVIIALIALCATAGCSRESTSDANDVVGQAPGTLGERAFRLELDATFGSDGDSADDDALLGRIVSAGIDDSGNVYIVDGQANQIIAFDSTGTVRWRTGRLGQGPGELRFPNQIFVSSAGLLLVNQAGSRLDEFDLNGRFIASHPRRDRRTFPLCWRGDSLLIEQAPIRGEWRIVIQESAGFPPGAADSAKVIGELVVDMPVEASPNVSLLINATCARDELLIQHPASYRIERWSWTGQKRGSFGRSDTGIGPPATASSSDGAFVVSTTFISYSPLTLPTDHFLVVAQWFKDSGVAQTRAEAMISGKSVPEIEWLHSIDLYDDRGALVSTIPGEGPSPVGAPLTTDATGRIYTIVNQPVPQVRRYRLEVL